MISIALFTKVVLLEFLDYLTIIFACTIRHCWMLLRAPLTNAGCIVLFKVSITINIYMMVYSTLFITHKYKLQNSEFQELLAVGTVSFTFILYT